MFVIGFHSLRSLVLQLGNIAFSSGYLLFIGFNLRVKLKLATDEHHQSPSREDESEDAYCAFRITTQFLLPMILALFLFI